MIEKKIIQIDPKVKFQNIQAGFQGEHNKVVLQFTGLEGTNFYLDLRDANADYNEFMPFPIPTHEFPITISLTEHATCYKAQICQRDENGDYIGKYEIMTICIQESVGSGTKAREIVPPNFKTEYDRMVETTNTVEQKLASGELKGDKGDKGDDGNVNYGTFDIDTQTGKLIMTHGENFDLDFELSNDGKLEVVL